MQIARVCCVCSVLLVAGIAAADTDVVVLRDGMQSEYAFCREDEWGGWGKRHPAIAMFRAGLLDTHTASNATWRPARGCRSARSTSKPVAMACRCAGRTW